MNIAFSLFLKYFPFGVGGWGLMLFFRRCKRSPIGIYATFRLHFTSGGQLHAPNFHNLKLTLCTRNTYQKSKRNEFNEKENRVIKTVSLLFPVSKSSITSETIVVTQTQLLFAEWKYVPFF